MGILNITPDSFSDGGCFISPDLAVAHAKSMIEEGVDIIDVGAESTRPGSDRVSPKDQLMRLGPVVSILHSMVPQTCKLSIDTTQSAVAEVALAAGVQIVNDISAGLDDPKMLGVVSEHKVSIVLMHMQGMPRTMQQQPSYNDVVEEVLNFLEQRVEQAEKAGIPSENIILDPGIGFGKTVKDNLRLLAEIDRFVATGYKVLLGTSRKRFMGALCAETRPMELLGATVATTAIGVMKGVKIFRVHDVKANRQAADVAFALVAAKMAV
jgi:dihydropteroate synthase